MLGDHNAACTRSDLRRLPLFACVLVLSCFLATVESGNTQTPAIVTILHLNDIYEIEAIEGGRIGGLARVATLIDTLRRTKPPVLVTLGGDFLSPSAIGTARIDGQPLAGRQMVDVLNGVGLDWATFGNHEFDVPEASFRARLAEAQFKILSSNVTDAAGQTFPGMLRSAVVPVRAGTRQLRIGLIGLTIDSNRQPWVAYLPAVQAAREQVELLRGKVDAIVALTHLSLSGDQDLVSQVPEIDLVLGGHEHENWLLRRGAGFIPIVKADANVRSVAEITMTFGRPRTRPSVSTRFHLIDQRLPKQVKVDASVRRWTSVAFDSFRRDGFSPETVVAVIREPLDGREVTVRNHSGALTDLIVAAFAKEAGDADVAILNGGSVRIDDVLQPGPVSEYDVIRVMPFGGKVLKASLEGELLASVLDVGIANQGTGGYLHTFGLGRDGRQWLVRGRPLEPNARYVVALPDFLLSGRETNLGFLTVKDSRVHDVQELRDVRRVVIEHLASLYPPVPR